MGMISWLTDRLEARAARRTEKATLEEWYREFGEPEKTRSGIRVNANTAMRATTVLACVRLRSQDVAKLPPLIFRLLKNGSRKEATDHPLFRLFRQPNPWQTWFEFCEQMEMALLLRGNAYAVVLRDPRGDPIAMVPVNPERVTIWEAVGGDIFYQIARSSPFEVAALQDFPQRISADDVFHLRFASSNTLVGLSPIGLAAEAVALAQAQERVAANLMGRGARPSGILTTEKRLNDAAVKRQKERWQAAHGGVDNSGGTAVLEEGFKFQALTLSSVDMEFIAARRLQVEEICRIFGVNPAKIGAETANGGPRAAFEQIQLAHYTDAIHPDLVRWEQKLTAYFQLAQGLLVTFDETELLRSDITARANAARVKQVSGITTPNESRKSFGLDPYPGGDVLLVPANVVPIEMAGQQQANTGPGSDQTGAPAEGGPGDATHVNEPAE